MPNQIDGNIKDKRSKILSELNKENEVDFVKKLVGREMGVLIERECSNKPGIFEGYTKNYVKAEISDASEE